MSEEKAVQMSRILCEPDRKYNQAEDNHLAASIKYRKEQGQNPLIIAISLQPIHDNPNYDYKVNDGRRRYFGLQKNGYTELRLGIDAVVIEGDFEVNTYVANQRTDLSLAEEITKLTAMRERYVTLDSLAAAIGHTPTWVARRLNLLNLSALWKKAMAEKIFGYMNVAHYESIATFPPEIQDQIFDYARGVEGRDLKTMSIRKFTELLYEKFATLLNSLPWKEEGCGKCPACRERKNNGFLFTSLMPEPRCMNREYLERKRQEYVAGLAAKEPEAVLVSQIYQAKGEDADANNPLAENTVLGPGDWRPAENPGDGIPAIIADGPQAGTKTYIQRPKAAAEAKPLKTKNLAERKKAKNKQRKRKAVETFIAHLKEMNYEVPERNVIFALIACKGVDSVCGSHYDPTQKENSNCTGLPAKLISYEAMLTNNELDKLLWRQLLKNIINELEYGQNGPEEVKWAEAELISSLIRYDLDKALEEATKALPDPKSWEALEKAERKASENKVPEAQAA